MWTITRKPIPVLPPPISLVYDAISGELRARNNHESQYNDYSDLRKKKSIGRAEFEQMILAPLNYSSSAERWAKIDEVLRGEGYAFSEIRRIKAAWGRYVVESTDYSNDLLTKCKGEIVDAISRYESVNEDYSLMDLLESISSELSPEYSDNFEAAYLQAATLDHLFNAHEQLQEVNTESPEETE